MQDHHSGNQGIDDSMEIRRARLQGIVPLTRFVFSQSKGPQAHEVHSTGGLTSGVVHSSQGAMIFAVLMLLGATIGTLVQRFSSSAGAAKIKQAHYVCMILGMKSHPNCF